MTVLPGDNLDLQHHKLPDYETADASLGDAFHEGAGRASLDNGRSLWSAIGDK